MRFPIAFRFFLVSTYVPIRWKSPSTPVTPAPSAGRLVPIFRLARVLLGKSSLTGRAVSGLRKTPGCRDLEVQLVEEGHRRRRMDRLHDGCCHCPQVRHLSLRGVGSPNINGQHRPSAAGVDGGVMLSGCISCCVFSSHPRIYMFHAMNMNTLSCRHCILHPRTLAETRQSECASELSRDKLQSTGTLYCITSS